MARRPYLVVDATSKERRLVMAGSQSAAIAHVVRGRFTARVPNSTEVVALLDQGLKAEQVNLAPQGELDAGERDAD